MGDQPSGAQPLLVVVRGKPGLGETTLARRLVEPDMLGLPPLSGDDRRIDLLASTGPGSDAARARAGAAAFALFLHSDELWLQAGLCLMADEALSPERGAAALTRWTELAHVAWIRCETSDAEAGRGCLDRKRVKPRQRAHNVQTMARWIARGDYPWRVFDTSKIGILSLRVESISGYTPVL